MRIRTALVTARSAPAHERAIRTLMKWNIRVDEAMFLGGLPKGEFLREFEPDFFFDDQTGHVDAASRHVPARACIERYRQRALSAALERGRQAAPRRRSADPTPPLGGALSRA